MQGLFASSRESVHQVHHLNLEMSQAQTVTLMGPMWDMITKQACLHKYHIQEMNVSWNKDVTVNFQRGALLWN